MSENYPSDVKLNENPDGTVSFATEVVATIAGLAATEVDGVASMSSPSSGFADMFSRKNTRNFTKGVRIDLDGNRVTVDITIVVEYGSPVPEVARNLQENVKKALETMTGLDVKSVDIHVAGISFEREQKANAELDEKHRKMLEKNAETTGEQRAEARPSVEEKEPEAALVREEPAEVKKEARAEEIVEVEEAEAEPEEEEEDEAKEEDEDFEDVPEQIDDEEDEKEAEPAPVPAPAPVQPVKPVQVEKVHVPSVKIPEPIEEQNYEDIEEVLAGDEEDSNEAD